MKRLFSIILAIIICMAMAFAVYADNAQYVFDEADMITTASEKLLNEKAAGIYSETGIIVSYMVVDEPDGGTVEYAEDAYKMYYGNNAGILLLETSSQWYIHEEGEAEEIFTSDDVNDMWEACGNTDYYNEGVDAYLDVAYGLLRDKGITAKAETAASASTASNHPSRLVDEADLLSADEEEDLESKLDEISDRQQFDVAVVTVDSVGGKTPEAFADDYFDYNGYGMGIDDDGIILVISMVDRKIVMSTHAFGITAFTDAGQDYIWDMIMPYISSESYAEAFYEFADLCDDFVTKAKNGEPYDADNMPDKIGLLGMLLWLIPSFIIAAIISLFLKKNKRKSLKIVMMRNDASDYWDELNITDRYDRYLRRDIVTVKVEPDGDGGGIGGSSIHMGASGRIHGGSSRSF